MKLEEIEILIGKDGKAEIHTSGFSGNECLNATESIEAILGNQLVSREMRPDVAEATERVYVSEKQKVRRG